MGGGRHGMCVGGRFEPLERIPTPPRLVAVVVREKVVDRPRPRKRSRCEAQITCGKHGHTGHTWPVHAGSMKETMRTGGHGRRVAAFLGLLRPFPQSISNSPDLLGLFSRGPHLFSKSDLLIDTYETKPGLRRSYEIWGENCAEKKGHTECRGP